MVGGKKEQESGNADRKKESSESSTNGGTDKAIYKWRKLVTLLSDK